MDDTGKPIYWNLENHIKAVIQMIQADELQIALKMCDEIPGFYRDNYPKELAEIKQKIYQQTYDQIEYATDDEEANCERLFGEAQWTNGYMYPRAELIRALVTTLNKQGLVPWIFDLGCSHGNLPLGLIGESKAFSYKGVGMNYRIINKVKEWVDFRWEPKPKDGQPSILYCTEVLEHCFNPHDVVHTSYKEGVNWDYILLSVPKYTLGGGLENWDTRRLGHVRTWTPREFLLFANDSWPGYKWEYIDSYSMVLMGSK